MNNNNKNKNNNNNNNNKNNGTAQSSDVDDSSSSSRSSSSGGQEGASGGRVPVSDGDVWDFRRRGATDERGDRGTGTELIGGESRFVERRESLFEDWIGFGVLQSAVGEERYFSVRFGRVDLAFALRGGPAARISSSYSYESVPKLSPDGKRIAFLAEAADGSKSLSSPAGGVARQVTHGAQAYGLSQWSGDHELLILTTQFSDLGNPQLAKVDALTGKVSVLPFEKAHGGTKDPKGCYLFYPLRQSSSTKRYEGGEQARIWRWCGEGAVGANGTAWSEAKELTPESWSMRGSVVPQTTDKLSGKVFSSATKPAWPTCG